LVLRLPLVNKADHTQFIQSIHICINVGYNVLTTSHEFILYTVTQKAGPFFI